MAIHPRRIRKQSNPLSLQHFEVPGDQDLIPKFDLGPGGPRQRNGQYQAASEQQIHVRRDYRPRVSKQKNLLPSPFPPRRWGQEGFLPMCPDLGSYYWRSNASQVLEQLSYYTITTLSLPRHYIVPTQPEGGYMVSMWAKATDLHALTQIIPPEHLYRLVLLRLAVQRPSYRLRSPAPGPSHICVDLCLSVVKSGGCGYAAGTTAVVCFGMLSQPLTYCTVRMKTRLSAGSLPYRAV